MLKRIIADRIQRDGPISFRKFMELALYYPEYGYYTSPDTDIGCRGDFYTSPHVHPVFGAMIGRQIEEMWRTMDMPDEFHIIEAGAGKGYLAGDMLAYFKDTRFYEAVRYTIIEINPHIQEKQQSLLAPFRNKIQWAASLSETAGITGCIVSNELLDAFPVHRICMDDGTLREVCVTIEGDTFTEVLCECSAELKNYLDDYAIILPAGYRTEINLELRNWLQSFSAALAEGFIFTIDYGYPAWEYYSPARNRGTLICYYQHQVSENPYDNIGRQDISAHVNFSAVKKWGEACGCATIGYCPQGTFLVSLGIDSVLQDGYNKSEDVSPGHGRVSALISPEGLGESHKVLIQYKGSRKPQLSGFSLRNRVDAL